MMASWIRILSLQNRLMLFLVALLILILSSNELFLLSLSAANLYVGGYSDFRLYYLFAFLILTSFLPIRARPAGLAAACSIALAILLYCAGLYFLLSTTIPFDIPLHAPTTFLWDGSFSAGSLDHIHHGKIAIVTGMEILGLSENLYGYDNGRAFLGVIPLHERYIHSVLYVSFIVALLLTLARVKRQSGLHYVLHLASGYAVSMNVLDGGPFYIGSLISFPLFVWCCQVRGREMTVRKQFLWFLFWALSALLVFGVYRQIFVSSWWILDAGISMLSILLLLTLLGLSFDFPRVRLLLWALTALAIPLLFHLSWKQTRGWERLEGLYTTHSAGTELHFLEAADVVFAPDPSLYQLVSQRELFRLNAVRIRLTRDARLIDLGASGFSVNGFAPYGNVFHCGENRLSWMGRRILFLNGPPDLSQLPDLASDEYFWSFQIEENEDGSFSVSIAFSECAPNRRRLAAEALTTVYHGTLVYFRPSGGYGPLVDRGWLSREQVDFLR